MSTHQLLKVVKSENQDFEWYPTTDEIIQTIKADLNKIFKDRFDDNKTLAYSVLDCGAGDGRVLKALSNGKMYAIEKSKPLLNILSKDIFVVGTEFKEQTLIDKKVDVVFCNPPYSEYEAWSEKIIKEARAGTVYLVIPERWVNSDAIKKAIESREAAVDILGSFDFLNADRAARAKIDIVRLDLSINASRHYRERYGHESKTDPFEIWFKENFKVGKKVDEPDPLEARNKEAIKNALVNGSDIVTTLQELYQHNLAKLIKIYQSLADIDAELLEEMNIDLKGVREALKLKVTNLKDVYWLELFNNLDKVTDKLCSKSRKQLLETLTKHTHVDFSASNAYAVVIWVIKNANHYFDDQLIDMVERMTEQANVKLYKSNQNTFGQENWRYGRKPDNLSHYQLDYRIVLERMGGLCTSPWQHEHTASGLKEYAEMFLDDLRTVATNIGFDTSDQPSVKRMKWESNKKNECFYHNYQTGKDEVLFEAKAFKNGNIHLKLNQKFICKLNVEFGRLKGWIKSPKEAADELNISIKEAQSSFKSNLQLENNSLLQLGFQEAC